MYKILGITIVFFILYLGCNFKKKRNLNVNIYCLKSLKNEKCFEINYNPISNFEEDKFWNSFFETFFKKKRNISKF